MANQEAIKSAIRTAADRAVVNRQADAGQQVRFEAESLGRVSRFFRETGGEDLVIRSWHAVLREFIDAGAEAEADSPAALSHLDRALAVFAMKDRLRGGAPRQYWMAAGGHLEAVGKEDIDPLNDPWLAERNR
jgi:hypothetical protein